MDNNSYTQFISHILTKEVQKRIISKYEDSYYFFHSKPINQFIYDVGNQSTITFNYLKNYYDNIQYLRRIYTYTNTQGKPEIIQRIKLISDYYAQAKMMTYEIPMMIITNTKSIFIKRARRVKKIQAEQGSSDQTQENQSIFDFSTKSNYLKSLRKDITDLFDHDCYDQDSLYEQDMDSSIHDVYEDQLTQIYREKQLKGEINKITEAEVNHLIFDFNDVDVQTVTHMIQEMKKTKTGSVILNSLVDSQVHQNNFQNSIKNQNTNHLLKNKKNEGNNQNHKSLVGSYLQLFQSKKHRKHASIHEMHNTLVSQVVQQYSKKERQKKNGKQKIKPCLIQNQEDSLSKQKKQRENNRKKIRQKAQNLLLRIKNEQKMIR